MTHTATIAVDIPSQRDPEPSPAWQLVELAKTGDRDALGELYRLYDPTVRRYLSPRLGRNPTLVDDLAADTWLRVVRNIHRIEFVGRDFGAWLVTIARNLVADHYKSGWASRVTVAGELLDTVAGEQVHEHEPDELEAGVITRLAGDELLATLAGMPGQQQAVLRLRFLEQLDVAETAAAMGITVGACKALQYRAVRALARALHIERVS